MKEKKLIEVGDLITMRAASVLSDLENKTITGIVVGITLEDQDMPQPEDYWIRVVFLDGTKSTLFHDEVDIVGKK